MPDRLQFLSTQRIGQLTGSKDPEGWPLLNDTRKWGVEGVDLGANTEHNGRLFIFFGDVAIVGGDYPGKWDANTNTDLVAWTDEPRILRHGGHEALGWNFYLPNDHQGATDATGQRDWRYCENCQALFWAPGGQVVGTSCPFGGTHRSIGWNFYLPNDQQGATDATGQKDWRFCTRCHGLFWAPGGQTTGTVCPQGGEHAWLGWNFYLPNREQGAGDSTGQKDWRFCARCHGLFYDGYTTKGICPGAPGGGFRLQATRNDSGLFDPFGAQDPIGLTHSLETPAGAFSHNGRVYVFAGISEPRWSLWPRPGNPAYGTYLVSKENPESPGIYDKEFLLSPRIGYCPRDASRALLESHTILGFRFVLPHAGSAGVPGPHWRCCSKCKAMFWDANQPANGVCPKGGAHTADTVDKLPFTLSQGTTSDPQNQADWRRCEKCEALVWTGNPSAIGLCPAGDTHRATSASFVLPHVGVEEDYANLAYWRSRSWRYCGKCAGLFWNGDWVFRGLCPQDGGAHDAAGFDFVLGTGVNEEAPHQLKWTQCEKCAGLFFDGYDDFKGRCPGGGRHKRKAGECKTGGDCEFSLAHDVAEDAQHQGLWRYCGKCAGLFYDGYDQFKGHCKRGGAHEAMGYSFVLEHNPGEDALNQGGWRFCTKCSGLVLARQDDRFTAAAPWVVKNADHPDLPQTPSGTGLVLLGFGYQPRTAFRLAFAPLDLNRGPRLQDVRYYTGEANNLWSEDSGKACDLPGPSPHAGYTSVSFAWLEGPKRWLLLYSNANDEAPDKFDKPAVARVGTTPWNWSDEVAIFDPHREQAYGRYMHLDDSDWIDVETPPGGDEHKGWAYGVFLLNRFTEWDPRTRELGIYYLLSLSSPYQVQVMYSRLRISQDP